MVLVGTWHFSRMYAVTREIWIKFVISYVKAWCTSFFHQSIRRNHGVVHYLPISWGTSTCKHVGISRTHPHMHAHTQTHFFILYSFYLKSLSLLEMGNSKKGHFWDGKILVRLGVWAVTSWNWQMSVIPRMKAIYVYRDLWTQLSVTPTKNFQIHVYMYGCMHMHYYNTCTCTLLCDV